jgi:hypothetical protein
MGNIRITAKQFYTMQQNKYKRIKKQSPEEMQKTLAYNKKTYSSQLKELKFLIETKRADDFTTNMYLALIEGRKITPKMLELIITKHTFGVQKIF